MEIGVLTRRLDLSDRLRPREGHPKDRRERDRGHQVALPGGQGQGRGAEADQRHREEVQPEADGGMNPTRFGGGVAEEVTA
jgi:hypothetical protein